MAASVLAFSDAAAYGAVAHEFLPGPSEQISKGVPPGCGGSPACVPGPLKEVNTSTVDAGHFWLAESLGNSQLPTRVDKFTAANGEFSPPQLNQEAGVSFMTGGVAVGHAGAEEQVYVGAGHEHQSVLAVFGPTGKLQPEGIWTGKSTPQGEFGEITGVAVSANIGATLGDVYVVNGRFVDVFPGEAGGKEPAKPIAQLGGFVGATGSGTLTTGSKQIESVMIATGHFAQNQEIQGVGIPAGTHLEHSTCSGHPEPCLEMTKPATAAGPVSLTAFDSPSKVAVSPANGDVLVAHGAFNEKCAPRFPGQCKGKEPMRFVDVFEPSGLPGVYNLVFTIGEASGQPFGIINGLAVDGEGSIYVAEIPADYRVGVGEGALEEEEVVGHNAVDQFDSTGKFVGRLTETSEGPFKNPLSLAADPVSGNVYVGDFDPLQRSGVVDVFGPTRIVPDVTTSGSETRVKSAPGGEGTIEATLQGTVNALGQGPATCQFALGATPAFGTFAPCDEAVAEGNAPVAVTATVKEGLAPGTRYVFRLQATNKNGTNPGEASDNRELTTPGPGIREESASDVSATAATLKSTIDPNGAPTSYYFQYGKSTAYEAQAPAAPGTQLGSLPGDLHAPPVHIQGLSPETEYHYRVVVVSQLQVQGGGVQPVSFAAPDQTFTTQGAGGQGLPDGRRWELVSPADKHGAVVKGNAGGAVQAAAGGSAATYVATIPTGEDVKGTKGNVQVFSTRTAAGWSSQDIPIQRDTPVSPVIEPEYRFFSSDLSAGLVEPASEDFNSLAPEVFPADTERGPYLRHNLSCPTAPAKCFQPLLLGCPPVGQECRPAVSEHADVPAGTKFGGNPLNNAEEYFSAARFLSASSDLSHVVLSSKVALTETPTGGKSELYEVSTGNPAAQQVRLVSLVPNEQGEEVPAADEPTLGNGFGDAGNRDMRHAISEDGVRVVFSSNPHLYLRDVAKGKTVQLDLPQAQCLQEGTCGDGAASPQFQLASADGSRVLFTDVQRLTKDASPSTRAAGGLKQTADLYQCEIQEVQGEPRCKLSDLTPAPAPHQAADVLGRVIGASEDGSWLYFAANGVLGDGAQHGASPGDCKLNESIGEGQCNLYAYHEGAAHLIATVPGGDFRDWSGNSPSVTRLTARVSPNGRYLTFMSNRSLTGYDNRDALSGKADQEVFLYSAVSGSLACASCNPSGARPVGVDAAKLSQNVIGFQVWGETPGVDSIAANIPGWTPFELGRAIYQTRYLSDSGRLFFNSHDALVPKDINNNEDVYQFEPAGVGDCSSASATFHAATGGCQALISSGTAAGESAFVDASENGNDVFFLTGERLVPKDKDTALDLYDAHACSAESACPEEAQAPANCVTADACRAASAPQPDIFGSPASATFSGQGNLAPPTAASPTSTAKALTRAQKLAKALKACRAKHNKRSRASCERQARKRYGSSARARKGSATSRHSTSSKGAR
ncbi:MAG TPA: hypothetical protein VGO29_10775 [Solirubrobacteraceae bacterium]|jgi:hypothetical protein|nr:hypothetical protein [Solirubrobacteraceae bacterium]